MSESKPETETEAKAVAKAVDPSESDEFAKLPGRPLAEGELDPELLKLSKPRTRVGWLLSLSVVVFCIFWMLTLRSDLAFSRQSDEPRSIALAEVDGLETDSFVALESRPDRARVARIHFGADLGSHLTPVLGSDGRLWLLTPASAFAETSVADGDTYAGRVKRLDDMPFFDQAREFFESRPVFEPLAAKTAVEALASGAAEIETAHSDRLTLTSAAAVEVVHRRDGFARIIVAADSRGLSDELAWRSALVRAGVLAQGVPPITGTTKSWTYEVPAPDGLAPIKRALEERRLGAAVIPVETVHTATWGQLKSRGSDLVVGERAMPIAEITTVAVAHRPALRGDAVVIVATEKPADYWYILWLYALFGGFFLLFGWSLVKAVRGSLPPTVAPEFEPVGEAAAKPAA